MTPLGLTPKMAQTLRVVERYIRVNRCAPAIDEIASALDCSKTNAHRLVVALERRGAIVREPGLPRSIALVPKGVDIGRGQVDMPTPPLQQERPS